MGIFCMIFGVALFLGSTGGGYILARNINAFLASAQESAYVGQTYSSFFGLPASVPMAPIVIAFSFIGFLIGLSIFMKGLTYQRLLQLEMYLDDE